MKQSQASLYKSVEIWVGLKITLGSKWKDIKAVWSSIWQWALSLCFSPTTAFGSQTGISPFLQPPAWYLRPMSYKLLCGLFRGITRLRIEDNLKETIQRDLTQHNRDQMFVWVMQSRLLVWGSREDALFSSQLCLYWPQMAWHIFMAHLWFSMRLKHEPLR